MYCVVSKDELYHHGILGQKWGVRRYQNSDGTLTEAGKKRYSNAIERRYKEENTGNGRYISSYRTNRIGVKKEFLKEWQNSKEYKKWMDLEWKVFNKYDGDAKAITKRESDEIIRLEGIADKKKQEIWERTYDKYAEALIKDLDLPVSKSAIDYIKTLETFYSM